MPKFLLFDIDGTLILTDSAGRRAVEAALWELYQIDQPPSVPYAGRTDQFIFREMLRAIGLEPSDTNFNTLRQAYLKHLPASLQQGTGRILPGVVELLKRLAEMDQFRLGLLTGNLPESAMIKLRHFGLDHYFQFGVYGDHSHDRCELASQACVILNAQFGPYSNSDVWVLGDTELDVECGKHIQARTLACCTGSCTAEQLHEAGADHVVADLSTTEEIIQKLLCI